MPLAASARRAEPAVDPFWVSRQSLDAEPDALKPGCGWLPADWMPQEALRRALRKAARGQEAVLTDYGPAQGSLPLRQLLARQFAAEGLDVGPARSSSPVRAARARPRVPAPASPRRYGAGGRSLLLQLPRAPGGAPGGGRGRAHDAAGPDPARFADLAERLRPRLYVTNAAIHNPTGASLSAAVAHRILRAAAAHDVTIVEDEIFADFEPEPSPRLAVFDGLERVLRIGSFSKTLSASVRCGYIAARSDWIEGLIDLQIATNFSAAGQLAATIVHTLLADGGYRRHLEALRRRLARARQDVGGRLEGNRTAPVDGAARGLLSLVRVAEGRTLRAGPLRRRQGVILAPGNVFSPSQSAGRFLRFNAAQMSDERAWDVLARGLSERL